jgi:hypothetical protein
MTLVLNCLIEIHQTLKGTLVMWDEHDFPKSIHIAWLFSPIISWGTQPRTPLLVYRPFIIFWMLLNKSYISKSCCIFKSLHELPQLIKCTKNGRCKENWKINKLLKHLEKWLNEIWNGKIKLIKSPRGTLVKNSRKYVSKNIGCNILAVG